MFRRVLSPSLSRTFYLLHQPSIPPPKPFHPNSMNPNPIKAQKFLRFSTTQLRFSSKMSDLRRATSILVPTMENLDRLELIRTLEASIGLGFSFEPLWRNPSPLIIVISEPSGVGKKSSYKIIEIKPLELRLKFGIGFRGRLHITEEFLIESSDLDKI